MKKIFKNQEVEINGHKQIFARLEIDIPDAETMTEDDFNFTISNSVELRPPEPEYLEQIDPFPSNWEYGYFQEKPKYTSFLLPFLNTADK